MRGMGGRIGAPAFFSALILSAGIFASSWIPGVNSLPFYGGLILLISSSSLYCIYSGHTLPAAISAPLLLLLVGIASGVRAKQDAREVPPALNGSRVVADGRLVEDPHFAGRSLRFLCEVERTMSDSGAVPFRGRVIVRWAPVRGDSAPPALEEGSLVSISGTLYPPGKARNPGEFDVGRWMRANGIDAELTVRGSGNLIRRGDAPTGPLRRLIVRPLRQRLLAGIDRTVGGEEGAFLKGLLIGERSGIDPETNEAFTRAGVSHVLAVSGSNVAVVLLFIGLLLRPLRGLPALRLILLCGGAILYMEISGRQPPVARATVMACTAVAALYFQERLNGLNLLGVAGLILLLADPAAVYDIGFQLSFCAVLSLILFTPGSERFLRRIPATGRIARFLVGVLRLMLISGIATLGTLALTAGAFGRLSIVGLIANVVVVPATGISAFLGAVTALVEPFSSWLSSIYGGANRAILWCTIGFTKWAAAPSWASISIHWFTAVHGVVACGFVTALVFRGTRWFRYAFYPALLLLTATPWLPRGTEFVPPAGSTRMTFLDVGQGDAIFLQTCAGRRVLIDTGPAFRSSDAAERNILPFLDRTGSRRIDALIITHAHLDHTGGMTTLLREAEVCSLFAPPAVARALTRELSRPVFSASSGRRIDVGPGGRCYVVGPEAEGGDSTGNGASVVLKCVANGRSWLLTGDAPVKSEGRMVSRYGRFLSADILKVGHHGSRTSSGEEFLDVVRPATAIVSVGRNNRFGHPAAETLKRLSGRRIIIRRTDTEGGIVTESP